MEHFYLYYQGVIVAAYTVDEMFASPQEFKVLCATSEELELVEAYQLIFGRSLDIDTMDNWMTKVHMRNVQMFYDSQQLPLRLPAHVYTTQHNSRLRGL